MSADTKITSQETACVGVIIALPGIGYLIIRG